MKNIALDLYRKWHRLRHPLQAPLCPGEDNMPRSHCIKEALDNGDFQAAEDWAEGLLAYPSNEREDKVFKGMSALLERLLTFRQNHEVLALFQEWQRLYPTSRWPARFELMYWSEVATKRRGQCSASEVSEAQWQDAWVIGQALFLKGLSLLGQGMDWFVAHTLCMHAQIFHEPDWVAAWCYGQDVPLEQVPSLSELIDLASPVLIDEWRFGQIQVPPLPAQKPAVISDVAEQVSPEAPSGFFWLMVGLNDSPYGYFLIHDYAFLRTDRWGGDEGEILAIAGSPLCQHLTEEERQQIRSIQWQDEVSSIVFEDPEMHDVDKRARNALKRGDLSPEANSQMLLWIHSCLSERWPEALKSTPLYQWRKLRSMRKMLKAGKSYQVDYKLNAALYYRSEYGCFPDDLTELLVPICYYGAPYAALYGVFCDNGWGGLKQDHDIAQQWYAYAVRLCPPNSRLGDMEYGILTQIKTSFDWGELRGPLWNLVQFLAEAGYADAQIYMADMYGDDRQPGDLSLSVQWYRAALREGQPDTYSALYFIGAMYTGRMQDVDPSHFSKTTPLSRAAYGMDAYLEFLERMALHPINTWTSTHAELVGIALMHLCYTVAEWPDHHAEYLQPVLHLLTRYADTLHIPTATAAIAYIWNYMPEDTEWERAVRLIARTRQQYPQNCNVIHVYDVLRNKDQGALADGFDRIAASVES